jgi:arylsulfatase A-like enzyme
VALLACLAGLGLAGQLALAATEAERSGRPNVIVIVSDDQGWADLGVQGIRKDVRTPHLDSLAADGVRFSRGYVSAPVCVPSRAGLLTGRHQTRFGIESNADGPLPPGESTIGDHMRQIGYSTALVGKWHLATSRENQRQANRIPPDKILWGDNATIDDPNLPGRRGFDDYFCGAMMNYAASFDLAGKPLTKPSLVNDRRDRIEVTTEAALAYLDGPHEKPFFLYVAYFAPHVPLHASKSYLEQHADLPDGERKTGLAMISAVDDGVGRIRSRLERLGIDRSTLIFFVSDNGAPLQAKMWDGSLNEPLVGEKGMLTEGGIRVPFLVSWPGTIPGGQEVEHPVITLDILPTALAAAGGTIDAAWGLDGVNLLPMLTRANEAAPHERLYWRFRSQAAVATERWKLLFLAPDRRLLFDLSSPDGERRDVAAEHPAVAAELFGALSRWCAEQSPPGLPKVHDRDDLSLYKGVW